MVWVCGCTLSSHTTHQWASQGRSVWPNKGTELRYGTPSALSNAHFNFRRERHQISECLVL